MRKGLAFTLVGLLVGILGFATSHAERSTALEGPPFRMARVVLRQDSLEASTTVAAWVRTDSESRKCLVTLLESKAATYGQTVFCGLRFVDGKPGVWLHIFLPFDPPPRFRFDVAVYQHGAEDYGKPMPCSGLTRQDPCYA